MSVRIYVALGMSLLALLIVCWSAVDAQQTYPSTGLDGFVPSGSNWAVSPPTNLDQQTGRNADMSPDHWGSSASLDSEDSYMTSTTAQEWDGNLETHPWLDEEEVVDLKSNDFPTNQFSNEPLESLPASTNPDKNSTIPLPPSAGDSLEIPRPPSSLNARPFSEPGSPAIKSPPAKISDSAPPVRTQPWGGFGTPTTNGRLPQSPTAPNRGVAPRPQLPTGDSRPIAGYAQPNDFVTQPSGTESQFTRQEQPNQSVESWADYGVAQNYSNDYQHSGYSNTPSKGFLRNLLPSRDRSRMRSRFGGWNASKDYYEYEFDSVPGETQLSGDPEDGTYEYEDYAYSEPTNGFSRRKFLGARRDRRSTTVWPETRPTRRPGLRRQLSGGSSAFDATFDKTPGAPAEIQNATQFRYPLSTQVGHSNAFAENADSGQPSNFVNAQPTGPPSATYRRQPNFRSDLGHRAPYQTVRGGLPVDNGQQFGYEEEHFPPMKEILATGRYYASVDLALVKPYFQRNNSIALSNGVARAFDWDYEVAPRIRLGFESSYGPGVELTYFQFDQSANLAQFTSDGVISGTTSTWLVGPSQWTRITAANAGETISTNHGLKIHQFGASFFKELKFKRARLNGIFGLQYINIDQDLVSVLTDAGGSELERLTQKSNLSVFGPRAGLEYYRPIGHTHLELVNHFSGSVLFGNRDQSVVNTQTTVLSSSSVDDFLSIFDIGFGIQSHRRFGENRSLFWKVGYVAQTWIGGGTAVSPQDDFGLRGYTFTVGFNR